MKTVSIMISYDEDKHTALNLYLEMKNTTAERELKKALDNLYLKNVPLSVRDYIAAREMNSGKKLKKTKTERDDTMQGCDSE